MKCSRSFRQQYLVMPLLPRRSVGIFSSKAIFCKCGTFSKLLKFVQTSNSSKSAFWLSHSLALRRCEPTCDCVDQSKGRHYFFKLLFKLLFLCKCGKSKIDKNRKFPKKKSLKKWMRDLWFFFLTKKYARFMGNARSMVGRFLGRDCTFGR